jgi:hypothetical protein
MLAFDVSYNARASFADVDELGARRHQSKSLERFSNRLLLDLQVYWLYQQNTRVCLGESQCPRIRQGHAPRHL